MKTSLKLFALGIVLMGFGASVNAQDKTATETSTANAAVLQALTITPGTLLNFGTFIPSASADGVVVVSSGGDRSFPNNVVTPAGVGVTPTAGVFDITGTAKALFSITLPVGVTTLTGSNGGTMTINGGDWTANLDVTAAAIGDLGTQVLRVGARLQVGTAQASGNYSGSYSVTVAYN